MSRARFISSFFAGVLAVAGPAAAGQAPSPAASSAAAAPQGGTIAERYERARRALEEHRAAEEASRAERDRLNHETETLHTRLIANAARVQELEAELSGTENELADLDTQARALSASFAQDRDKVAHLLAVLQRLDTGEPPALAMRPDDSLAAARGAMLLGAMLPPVYARAAELARELRILHATQAAFEKKRAEARATAAALDHARTELNVLLDQRSREAEAAEAHLSEVHALAEEVAHEAGDLQSLLDRIAALRAASADTQGMTVVTADSVGPATLRRGSLLRPVVGRMLRGGPGAPGPEIGGSGAPAADNSGLWFEAAGGAQAIAPADSEVVFAGPYQKFGQVLILEIAGGYHLLLAGLSHVDVHIGDRVLAGEPVGGLPEGPSARLYMELRRNGEAVNAVPWLAAELRKAKGS